MEPASGSAFSYPAAGIIAKDASIPRPWDFNYGNPYTKEVEAEILEALKPAYIQGFALLGGEPFEPENQKELAGLLQKIKESYPEKNVWCYTGYLYDVDLIPGGKVYTEYTDKMLACIDTLVDGEFIEDRKRSHPGIPRKPQPENPSP